MKLSTQEKNQIIKAIEAAELKTSGEIRVHISYSRKEESPLNQAQIKFNQLEMHKTKDRNGVLLYINPKVKKFALYGDQGIHEKLGQEYWNSLKDTLKLKIREKDLTTGIIHAIEELGIQLKKHFPFSKNDQNELINELTESD